MKVAGGHCQSTARLHTSENIPDIIADQCIPAISTSMDSNMGSHYSLHKQAYRNRLPADQPRLWRFVKNGHRFKNELFLHQCQYS